MKVLECDVHAITVYIRWHAYIVGSESILRESDTGIRTEAEIYTVKARRI